MKAFRSSIGILFLAMILVSSPYLIPISEQDFTGATYKKGMMRSTTVPKDTRDDIYSPLTNLSSGDSQAEISFPMTGGIDSNNSITLPPRITINEARFNLTSKPLENVTISHVHDYTDTINNSAWKGAFTGTSPASPPADYMDVPYDGVDYNNVIFSDDLYVECILRDGKSPYQLFEFTVNETSIKEIYLFFEGLGYYRVGMANYHYNVTLFIFNESFNQWDNIAQKNERQPPAGDFTMSHIISTNHTDYIDDQNKLYLMAVGPYDPSPDTRDEWLRCDRAFINVKTLETIHPSNITLDVGNDGKFEWVKNNIFTGEVTISDDEGLAVSLQQIIDNGSEINDIVIPIMIGSGSGGSIIIDTLFISFEKKPFNPTPILSRLIPSDFLEFAEDSDEGDNLLDLSDFFKDDDQGNLSYEIILNHKEINASIDPDGVHMDFSSIKDYYGRKSFQVKALDLGLDGIRDTEDDLSNISNIFNVTVYPTNDAPVLRKLNSTIVLPEQIQEGFRLDVWEDLPANFVFDCFDVDGDILSYSIMDQISSPGKIDMITDTQNRSIVEITIHATNENIGWFNTSIIISDDNGSGPLFLKINLSIFIHNTNDGPGIIMVGENIPDNNFLKLDVPERNWLNFTIEASDPDPDDRLSFSCNRTDGLGNDDLAGMELIQDPDTMIGRFSFQAEIAPGNYLVNISVSDLAGAYDWVNMKITVLDVNENPVVGILDVHGGEQNLSVVIVAKGFTDPDGDPLMYDWDLGDDMGEYLGLELIQVNHTYKISGNYTVKLGLIDGRGGSLEVNITIQVTAPPDDIDDNGNEIEDDDTSGPDDNNSKDSGGVEKSILESNLIWIVGGTLLLLLVVGIIFIVLGRNRKKEENDDTEPSIQSDETSPPSNEISGDDSFQDETEKPEVMIKSENLESTDESDS